MDLGKGHVYMFVVAHDDNCPTLRSQSDADCTCETTLVSIEDLTQSSEEEN